MPLAEARMQKLNSRLTALVLRDRSKRFLLGLNEREELGFSVVSQPEPGDSYEESCQRELARKYGKVDGAFEIRSIWPPCAENGHAFTAVCEQRLSSASLNSIVLALGPGIIANAVEIRSLIEKDYFISPFFRLVFASGILQD